jgi:nucleoside-diphosphate-sugar epimerase
VGRSLAQLLSDRGDESVVVTRSGTQLGVPGAVCVAADARDPDALVRVGIGATTLYNCANPASYQQWGRQWPPLAASMLSAAERLGAVYGIVGNLYPYGPVHGPMGTGLADVATEAKGMLRARIWADARAAHDAGRVRAFEVRGSDYVGAGAGSGGHISRQIESLRRGRRIRAIGSPDQLHTFTDTLDVARTLLAVAAAPAAAGRVWHVPSNPPVTVRDIFGQLAARGRFAQPSVSGIPASAIRALSVFSPLLREVVPLLYQWTSPYVLDDSGTRGSLGLDPSPWGSVLDRTLDN